MRIPFNRPYLAGGEESNVSEAVQSRKHCGNHSFGQRCIDLMKERYGFLEVFLTPSCTAGMEMGAMLADLQPGDEVILPSYTFSSTANAVVLRGAKPVFCDVDPRTMNMDPRAAEALLTDSTRMILPIDYAGIPCDIESFTAMAKGRPVTVMEDAAQSFHSFHPDGRACGSVPPLAAFSFHETKNTSCGEGGALVVNDPALVERAHFLQEKGTDRSLVLQGVRSKYSWVDIGSSFLLADILAAVLLAQLEGVDTIVAKRSRVTEAYAGLFGPYARRGAVGIPVPPEGVVLNHHAYFVIFASTEDREVFLSRSRDDEVYPYIGYMPLHTSPMGQRFGYRPEDLPVTDDVGARIVRLPFYTDLADEGLGKCVDVFGGILDELYG